METKESFSPAMRESSDWAVAQAFREWRRVNDDPYGHPITPRNVGLEIERRARELDASGGGGEPFKWEGRRYPNGLKRYLTQRQYDAQSPAMQAHYKPICETCATPRAAEAGDKVSIPPRAAEVAVTVAEEWKAMFDKIPGLEKYELFTYGPAVDDLIEELQAAMGAVGAGD